MTEEVISSAKMYKIDLLNLWGQIRELSLQLRKNYLQGRLDQKSYAEYVALLGTMWGELSVVMENRPELGDLSAKFKEYENDFYKPVNTYVDIDRALRLQILIRTALEKLDITRFEEKL